MKEILYIFIFLILLVLQINAETIELTVGEAKTDDINIHDTNCYSISLTEAKSLTITLSINGYGDADLYASLSKDCPSKEEADYKSETYGDDVLNISKADLNGKDKVYISIYAFISSRYTLLAAFDGDTSTILDGVPQSGVVNFHETLSYDFTLSDPDNAKHLLITATSTEGFISVYISTNGKKANADNYDKKSVHQFSGEEIAIENTEDFWPSNGKFNIGVEGTSTGSSSFTLTAASNGTHIELINGSPVYGHVVAGGVQFYSYLISADSTENDCTLSVTMSLTNGDADLFMSTTTEFPSVDDHEYASLSFGNDNIDVANPKAAKYYIAVVGFSDARFSIVSSVSCTGDDDHPEMKYTSLIDGQPQSGTLNIAEYRYYKFKVNDISTSITITATKSYGDPDLYITTDINDGDVGVSNNIWHALATGPDAITIDPSDENYCSTCTYYIGVRSFQDTGYIITASLDNTIVALIDGTATSSNLKAESYNYFKFYVDKNDAEVDIITTPFGNGDPDLYVSTKDMYPNKTNHEWAGIRFNADSVTIPSTDPNFCSDCWYYISVYAFTDVTFTILASMDKSIELQEGVPQSGVVSRGEFKYYLYAGFQDDDTEEISITLTVNEGSASLYVGTKKYPELSDSDSYDYYSGWYEATKSFNIKKSDVKNCDNTCQFYIGVFGEQNATYALVGSAGTTSIALQDGNAQYGHVNENYWNYFYYSVHDDDIGKDLSIILTSISGDPDMYINFPNNTKDRPTDEDYDVKADDREGGSIDFTNIQAGTYHIGITGFVNSTYTLVAIIEDSEDKDPSIIVLNEGVPQSGAIHEFRGKYYVYHYGNEGEGDDASAISFVLSTTFGDPDIYVTYAETNDNNIYPSDEHNDWKSTKTTTDTITIASPSKGYYYIGISSFETSTYTLTVSSAATVTTLQDGKPLYIEQGESSYAYYSFNVRYITEDFTISVTPFTGDPDLYVSTTNHFPSQSNYTWSSNSFKDDAITISHSDANFKKGLYYIAVYAFRACTYTITVQQESAITLLPGISQEGSVAKHAMKYYRIHVTDDKPLEISITPLTGSCQLFMSKIKEPTITDYTWKSNSFNGGSIKVETDDENYCSGLLCFYMVGVYGLSASNYTISARSGDDASTALQNGIPYSDSVEEGKFKYYEYTLSADSDELDIIVTPTSGDPDVYVSIHGFPGLNAEDDSDPSSPAYSWASITFSDVDSVKIEDAKKATYYIGVQGYEAATYSITVSTKNGDDTSDTLLLDGVPQNGNLAEGAYKIYSFQIGTDVPKLTITLTPSSGDPDLYITDDGTEPTSINYQYASIEFGADLAIIHKPKKGLYRIRVDAFDDTEYSITASTASSNTVLIEGVPVNMILSEDNAYEYFEFEVNRIKTLSVTCTSWTGDPDIYVSTTNHRPNVTDFEYAARGLGSDSLTIPENEVKEGKYYISVYAEHNVTFSLLVTLDSNIMLVDGLPQSGLLAKEQSKYYTFKAGKGINQIIISSVPYYGSGYLYVATNDVIPDIHKTYETVYWSSTNTDATQTIVIKSGDENFVVIVLIILWFMVHQHVNMLSL